METEISYIHARTDRETEGLNSAIEVLVVYRVLIVPQIRTRVSYFITHQPNAVVTRIGCELVADGCACPSHDGGLHSHGRGSG
jgi:hypothetical protein